MERLAVQCGGEARKSARATWSARVLRWAYETAADVGGFLRRRLTVVAGGGLLYAGGAGAAFGCVTGILPTDFVVILRLDAVRCGASVRASS